MLQTPCNGPVWHHARILPFAQKGSIEEGRESYQRAVCYAEILPELRLPKICRAPFLLLKAWDISCLENLDQLSNDGISCFCGARAAAHVLGS